MSMIVLPTLLVKTFPTGPEMKNISVMQNVPNVLEEDFLYVLVVKVQFGNMDPTAWKRVGQYRRELSPNEAHSYAYLLHYEDFNLTRKEVRANQKDMRSHGYYYDNLILIENF